MAIRPILRLGHPRAAADGGACHGVRHARACVSWFTTCSRRCAPTTAPASRPSRSACLQRVVVFELTTNPRYPDAEPVPLTVLVNPEIEFLDDEREPGWEGCLSVPGMRGLVPRYRRLRYRGFDELGQPIDRTVEGLSRARGAARVRSPRRHPVSAAHRGHDGVRLSGRARRERRVAAGRRCADEPLCSERLLSMTDGKLVTLAVIGARRGLGAACRRRWTSPRKTGERTVRDGVFSAAQAVRGERLFESICANCHEIAEFTAAGAYLEDVEGKPLWETFEYISVRDARGRSGVAAARGVRGRSRLHLQRLRPAERRSAICRSIRSRSRRSRSSAPRFRAASRRLSRLHDDDPEPHATIRGCRSPRAGDAAAAQGRARVQRRRSRARSPPSRRDRAGTAAAQRRLHPGACRRSSRPSTSSPQCCCSLSTRASARARCWCWPAATCSRR